MPTKSSFSLPLIGTHFSVDFGTNQVIKEHSFSEIDVPNLEFKTKEENAIIAGQKEFYPDGFEFGDLVLKRGKTSKDSYLFKWLKIQIDFQRKLPIQIVVKLLNHEHSPFLKWTFLNAFPIKFDTSGISSTSKDVMLDSITFKFESFKFDEIDQIGPAKIKNDEYALAKNTLRLARQTDGMLQKKPLKISPPKPKSSRINRKTSQKKPPK